MHRLSARAFFISLAVSTNVKVYAAGPYMSDPSSVVGGYPEPPGGSSYQEEKKEQQMMKLKQLAQSGGLDGLSQQQQMKLKQLAESGNLGSLNEQQKMKLKQLMESGGGGGGMEEMIKEKQRLQAQIAEKQKELGQMGGQGGFGWTTTPTPTRPGMDTMSQMKAVQAAMNGDPTALEHMAADTVEDNMKYSNEFTEGFITAFFDNTPLLPGERACLSRDASAMIGDSTGATQTAVTLILEAVAKEKPDPMVLLSGAGQAMGIVTGVQDLVKNCVQSDALGVLTAAKNHLSDIQYIKHRFMANGVDMMRALADSIPAIETNNWGKAGGDLGAIVRKTVMSPNNDQMQMVLQAGALPTDVPGQVMTGVVAGLFPPGSNVTITDKVDPAVDIYVDLYQCVGKHASTFSDMLNVLYVGGTGMLNGIEQMQKAGGIGAMFKPGGLGTLPQTGVGNTVDYGAMMTKLSSMTGDFMMIFSDCGINEESQAQLKECLKDIKNMKVTPGIAGPADLKTQTGNAALKVEYGTKAFEEGNYPEFGVNLGGVMRDLLLTVYKQKFTNMAGEFRPPPVRLQKRRLREAESTESAFGQFFNFVVETLFLA